MGEPQEYRFILKDMVASNYESPSTLPDETGRTERFEPKDKQGDLDLLATLNELAKQNGLEVRTSQDAEYKKPLEGALFYGGIPGLEWVDWQTITYAAGSLAAFTVFLNNALDVILKWKKLKHNRSFRYESGDEKKAIKDKKAALRLLAKLESRSPKTPKE